MVQVAKHNFQVNRELQLYRMLGPVSYPPCSHQSHALPSRARVLPVANLTRFFVVRKPEILFARYTFFLIRKKSIRK